MICKINYVTSFNPSTGNPADNSTCSNSAMEAQTLRKESIES